MQFFIMATQKFDHDGIKLYRWPIKNISLASHTQSLIFNSDSLGRKLSTASYPGLPSQLFSQPWIKSTAAEKVVRKGLGTRLDYRRIGALLTIPSLSVTVTASCVLHCCCSKSASESTRICCLHIVKDMLTLHWHTLVCYRSYVLQFV